MRARHRLSKLLLRHGLVYDGTAWTRAHDGWLRRQRLQDGPLAIVFDECYGRMLDAKTRRDALDKAISRARRRAAVRRGRRAARLSPRRLDTDGVRVDRRARRLESVPSPLAWAVSRSHPERALKRRATSPRRDHQGWQLSRASSAGRGRLAPTPAAALERHAGAQTHRQVARCASASGPQRPPAARTLASARAPRQAPHDRRGRRRARVGWALLGPGDHGVAAAINRPARRAHRRNDARSDPR